VFVTEYDGLHRKARDLLEHSAWGERSLGPTDLVHEAALRLLVDARALQHPDPRYQFAAALRAMRQVLLDRARSRDRIKRGGRWRRVPIDDVLDYVEEQRLDLGILTAALERLAQVAERPARVIALRYFSRMKVAEIARELKLSVSTIEDDLAFGKAWLRRELGRPG
jgi:RNA polymerase sigma factor (TIGR02999 family)